MFVRLGHLMLVLALLCATGGHWAVLQTVAWTQMIVERSQIEPLPRVVAQTLRGEKPCALCEGIADGRKSEKPAEFPAACCKLDFICSTTIVPVFPPAIEAGVPFVPGSSECRRDAPPVPPPRVHAV